MLNQTGTGTFRKVESGTNQNEKYYPPQWHIFPLFPSFTHLNRPLSFLLTQGIDLLKVPLFSIDLIFFTFRIISLLSCSKKPGWNILSKYGEQEHRTDLKQLIRKSLQKPVNQSMNLNVNRWILSHFDQL